MLALKQRHGSKNWTARGTYLGVKVDRSTGACEADILSGHFQSTRDRTVATDGLVLVLHDTTEFTYQRERPELIGITKSPLQGAISRNSAHQMKRSARSHGDTSFDERVSSMRKAE